MAVARVPTTKPPASAMTDLHLRGISFVGLFAMIGLAWLMSRHKRQFPLRVVIGGLVLQASFALMILHTRAGERVFDELGDFFTRILSFVDAGSEFVFGAEYSHHLFAFQVLPTIVFFSALMSILYHLGVVQIVVSLFARVMQYVLGTSGAESLSAAANIFVGQTEAPLVVRPYVAGMTQSELMAVMVGGFATIAGGVLAAYVGMIGEAYAGHFMTASVISAPAALLIAKVMLPEVEHPQTLGVVEIEVEKTTVNVVEAAAAGATDGMKLAINVAAMLIAFIALIAMGDAAIGLLGQGANWLVVKAMNVFGTSVDPQPLGEWTLTGGLGYLFAPLAWMMGIESRDCLPAGQLLGTKVIATEFVAYLQLGEWMAEGSDVQLTDRTKVILTYALSGFANFGSIGIQIAGIGGIAPERRSDLALLGVRAMIGGTLACCMTGCIAGVLI